MHSIKQNLRFRRFQIKEENNMPKKKTNEPEVEMIIRQTVLEMGFTRSMIAKLLPELQLKTNHNYRSGPPMKLWPKDVVEAAMQTDAFRELRAKADRRSQAGKEVAAKKEDALLDKVDEMLKMLRAERWPLEEVRQQAIADREDQNFQHGNFETDPWSAGEATVTRWMVNFVRHQMVWSSEYGKEYAAYDAYADWLKGKVGRGRAYFAFRSGVLDLIAKVYPELKAECSRQKSHG